MCKSFRQERHWTSSGQKIHDISLLINLRNRNRVYIGTCSAKYTDELMFKSCTPSGYDEGSSKA
jgi:hypothetical protein